MIDSSSPQARKPGPFVPANTSRKPEAEAASQFSARHFAAKRAGFLLREYARQQESDPRSSQTNAFTIASGDAEGFGVNDMRVEIPAEAVASSAIGVSDEEVARLVAEAEQRGREVGQAELVTALDQAIAALDAAGRAVSDAQADLERRWVAPLAQASLHIGSELARQVLADAQGLQRYLEAVTAAIQPAGAEADSPLPFPALEVRMNPEDLAVLERSAVKPSSITFVSDSLVPRAGAIASSENKVVDDRFENRIRFAKDAVLAAAADLLREAPA